MGIFPRTRFARTCAFYLIFVRTRTHTSKVHIYNFLPFLPQIWIFFLKRKNNFGFFFISEKLGIFFLKKKENSILDFFLEKLGTVFHDCITKIQVRSHMCDQS